jgi:hypothetical protein
VQTSTASTKPSTISSDKDKKTIDNNTNTPSQEQAVKKVQPFLDLKISGYLQTGYRFTFNDPKLLRLGESDGFYVRRARLKTSAEIWNFQVVLSIDGAYDRSADPLDVSPATRKLFAELRDAYISYRHPSGFFVTAGQDKVPFGIHSDRSTADERFILFPLIAEGEDISFGYQVRPIIPGRDIGLQVGFNRVFQQIGFNLAAMVYNGNGSNRFANDSDTPAVAARLNLTIGSLLKIGGSFLWNKRRIGQLPNLLDESDLAFGADLSFQYAGFFLEGEFAARTTSHITIQQKDEFAYGFRADTGYLIKAIGLEIALRVEMYDPSDQFDDDRLLYISAGLNWYYRIWNNHSIAVRLFYTFKLEQTEARSLNNDQINLLLQYRFD